jgi:hypothetical protein
MDLPEFGHLFTTGQEYVEYIHRIPTSERRWHHEAYLWYHRNAKVILLGLAIFATIYAAIVYRGLVSLAAASGSIKSRSGLRKVVMTGGTLDDLFSNNFGDGPVTLPEDNAPTGKRSAEKIEKGKQAQVSKEATMKSARATEAALAARKAKVDSQTMKFNDYSSAFKATPSTSPTQASTTAQASTKPTPATNSKPTPSQQDEAKRDAKIQSKRESTAVKAAKQGDRPNYMSEGAHKRLTAAKEKMKDVGAKIKGAPKAFYKDLKSGKVGAQAKLMTQAAGARIHDTVAQNASSVYTIIFSLFLFSGVALYFIPTLGMIGISMLTFYMFSDFVRGIITL